MRYRGDQTCLMSQNNPGEPFKLQVQWSFWMDMPQNTRLPFGPHDYQLDGLARCHGNCSQLQDLGNRPIFTCSQQFRLLWVKSPPWFRQREDFPWLLWCTLAWIFMTALNWGSEDRGGKICWVGLKTSTHDNWSTGICIRSCPQRLKRARWCPKWCKSHVGYILRKLIAGHGYGCLLLFKTRDAFCWLVCFSLSYNSNGHRFFTIRFDGRD